MLTTLEVVLRQAPATMAFEQSTNVISSFLGPPPHLSLSEACAFGSLELLDWIWSSSSPDLASRTSWWSLNNFLPSDPHYHNWQFSKSLEVALTRGDVELMDWIFAHFTGCEAPSTVADRAIENGNLRVLWRLRERQANRQGDDQARECTVHIGPLSNYSTTRKACENGQLSQCLDDGMQLSKWHRETAIRCALELGNTVLAERLLPVGRCLLDYAARCPRVEMIEWMLDCGYLRRDKHLAAWAMPGLASSGRLDLMQQVLQLHSPLPSDNSDWVNAWIDAVKEACSCGNDVVLHWLLDHSLGIEASDCIREEKEPGKLFLTAAENGYVDVMESLHSQRLTGDNFRSMDEAVEKGHLNSIKWLLDHCPLEQLKARRVIDKAAEYGHVEVLRFFHDLDASGVEVAEAKRRKTTSWWSSAEDPIYWAAKGDHLAVLEWIQANRSQPCEADAMDIAADQGHLKVVEWLHANRSEGCTYQAMDAAACNGHLEVLKWLHANRTEGYSDRAMYCAVERGHLDVVKWLYAHCPDPLTYRAIDRGVRSGHLRIVSWLQPLFPDYKIGSCLSSHKSLVTVDGSWDSGNTFEVLLCLHVRYGYVFTSRFLEKLRTDLSCRRRYPYLLKYVENWLDEHYPSK